MAHLFRQINQQNPHIKTLVIDKISDDSDVNENIGELILDSLLSSNINSITNLQLTRNSPWFKIPGNVDILAELITKQAGLEYIILKMNWFTSKATLTILSRIAEHPSTRIKLKTLNL